MPGPDDGLGKKAEQKIKEWLDHPEDGISFDRIPDQLTGQLGSKNICDFVCFQSPYQYYIESKATFNSRFDFNMITEYQHDGLLKKSEIANVFGLVIVLFATYQRAFVIDIREIKRLEDSGQKSLNIEKINKWPCKYAEIRTIHSRKQLLDYSGNIEEYTNIAAQGGICNDEKNDNRN